MGQIIRGTKLLFACLPWFPVEAPGEAWSAATEHGRTSALLAKLSGKSGSLAKVLVICTNSCEDAPESRAAREASQAIMSNKSWNICESPSERKRIFYTSGESQVQLVLCSNAVSYPVCAQGDSHTSLACQPAGTMTKHHLPGGGRTAGCCCASIVTSSLPRCVEQIGKGESWRGKETAHFWGLRGRRCERETREVETERSLGAEQSCHSFRSPLL